MDPKGENRFELLYFSDPMCSWCYGFGPELARLVEARPETPLRMIQGGLRPDERRPMPGRMAAEIASHWHHVEEAAGRPFDYTFFEKNPEFVYDTAPACKAVVTAGRLDPKLMLAYQAELQKRFYANGQDPTKEETFVAAARSVGLDGEAFLALFEDSASEDLVREHFATSREFGVGSYPTLALRVDERYYLVARGFARFDDLQKRISAIEVEAGAPA